MSRGENETVLLYQRFHGAFPRTAQAIKHTQIHAFERFVFMNRDNFVIFVHSYDNTPSFSAFNLKATNFALRTKFISAHIVF